MTETLVIAAMLIALTTAGQLLLKKAAHTGGIRTLAFWTGNGLFVTTVALSFVLMSHVQLKYFSAIMSLNYVAVMLASAAVFGERIGSAKAAGTVLVLIGVAVFVYWR